MLFGLILGVIAILIVVVIMNSVSDEVKNGVNQAKAVHFASTITNLKNTLMLSYNDYTLAKNEIFGNKHFKKGDLLAADYRNLSKDILDDYYYELDGDSLVLKFYISKHQADVVYLYKNDYNNTQLMKALNSQLKVLNEN